MTTTLGPVVLIHRGPDRRSDGTRVLTALAAGAMLVLVASDERITGAKLSATGTVTLDLEPDNPPEWFTQLIQTRPEPTVTAHYQGGSHRGHGRRIGKGERKRNRAGRWT